MISALIIVLIKCDKDDLAFITKKQYKYVTVLSITPAIGSVSVAKNTYISINFSEAMNTSTFANAISLESNLGFVSMGSYTQNWSNNNTTLTLIPTGIPLASDTIYSITINTDIRSAEGNPMSSNY